MPTIDLIKALPPEVASRDGVNLALKLGATPSQILYASAKLRDTVDFQFYANALCCPSTDHDRMMSIARRFPSQFQEYAGGILANVSHEDLLFALNKGLPLDEYLNVFELGLSLEEILAMHERQQLHHFAIMAAYHLELEEVRTVFSECIHPRLYCATMRHLGSHELRMEFLHGLPGASSPAIEDTMASLPTYMHRFIEQSWSAR